MHTLCLLIESARIPSSRLEWPVTDLVILVESGLHSSSRLERPITDLIILVESALHSSSWLEYISSEKIEYNSIFKPYFTLHAPLTL